MFGAGKKEQLTRLKGLYIDLLIRIISSLFLHRREGSFETNGHSTEESQLIVLWVIENLIWSGNSH